MSLLVCVPLAVADAMMRAMLRNFIFETYRKYRKDTTLFFERDYQYQKATRFQLKAHS